MAKKKHKRSGGHHAPPAKSNKFLVWAVVVVVIVVVLFLMRGQEAPKAAPTAPQAPEAPATAPEAPAAPSAAEAPTLEEGTDVTEAVLEDKKEEKGLAVDASLDSEVLSQVACADGVVSLVLKNTADEDWTVRSKETPKGNVALMNRGLTDVTPECDDLELAPGESTICKLDLGVVEGENRIAVSTPTEKPARIAMC